ncbi:MAG: GntP family permease [Acidobacteriota bacterium]
MESDWTTLGILALGIAVVVGGMLWLKLHAFLALIVGALLVGLLTPRIHVERYGLDRARVEVVSVTPSLNLVELGTSAQKGTRYMVLRADRQAGQFVKVGELEVEDVGRPFPNRGRQIRSMARWTAPNGLELASSDRVVSPEAHRAARQLASQSVGERVATEFGATCAKIGLLIAMASLIGRCLLESGAADRIVRSALRAFGQKGAPMAFLASGFLLGIPVFFDTVFYLLIPLGKALHLRTKHSYLFYVLTIVAGATMTHSLVPPTPGPLFVAEQLGVDVGVMILAGMLVGLFTSMTGYLYASFVNRRWHVPLRDSELHPLAQLQDLSNRNEQDLPPLWLALLPIILPVALIGSLTIVESLRLPLPTLANQALLALGDKNTALFLAAGVSVMTLVQQKKCRIGDLSKSLQSALEGAGMIILITAGGGAFGGLVQQTGVDSLVRELPRASPAILILLAFLITVAVRTAQGSATVAMITAVGILSGIADPASLRFHPVYLALAIGCGSKPIQWMNDSGFWVICRMSDLTESEMLRFVTPMTGLMGVVGVSILMLAVSLFPMAP